MPTISMSSKGQLVLPAALRRKLGMGAGAQIEVVEEADGLKLRVLRPLVSSDISRLAGMVVAPPKGFKRSLDAFDAATLLKRPSQR